MVGTSMLEASIKRCNKKMLISINIKIYLELQVKYLLS